MLHHLPSPSLKQYNLVVAKTFGRGNKNQFLPGDRRIKLRTERPSKFIFLATVIYMLILKTSDRNLPINCKVSTVTCSSQP